jgi:hypothetical protein
VFAIVLFSYVLVTNITPRWGYKKGVLCVVTNITPLWGFGYWVMLLPTLRPAGALDIGLSDVTNIAPL